MSSPGRIEQLAREIAAREAERAGRRAAARDLADGLHGSAKDLLRRFARAAGTAGAPHLDLVRLGPVEPDDKSIRAWQFKIWRGRWEAVVVSKDRGEVMLVGPYKRGEPQGPCNGFHLEGAPAERDRLRAELPDLICRLIEAAFEK